jgi:hypothetical protein
MAALVSTVHVRDEDGVLHVFGPDSEVPEWAQRSITHKAAWENGEAPVFEEEPDYDAENGEPARSGRGSSHGVWIAYARSLGIEVPDGATRDDVIKLVDEKKAQQG